MSKNGTRNTITHELLHLHHVRITDIIRLGKYRETLGQNLYDQLEDQVKMESEYMVDALSTVIADGLPLPPDWPDNDVVLPALLGDETI